MMPAEGVESAVVAVTPVALLVVVVPSSLGLIHVLSVDRMDPGRRDGTPGGVLEGPVPVSDK